MIELAAELKNLEICTEEARAVAVKMDFDKSSIMQIELALEEAIVNIIHHAYADKPGIIRFECKPQGDSLVIKIVDFGIPFDILSVADPDLDAELEDRKVGGLGIFFIRKFMDNVQYERTEEGNILLLEKIRK